MAAAIRLSQQHSCSFNHLVGQGDQRWREFEAVRLRRLEVEHHLELGWLQDREVCWFFALKDAAGIDADLTIHVQNIDSVTHQLAHFDIFSDAIHGRNRVTRRQRDYLLASARKAGTPLPQSGEGSIDLARGAGMST